MGGAAGGPAQTLDAVLRVIDEGSAAVDVKHVLHRAVEGAVAATGADHAAVLVVDDDALVPVAVAARRPNAELFRRFRSMAAIPLHEDIDRRAMLFAGSTVVVDDCRSGGLVPPGWIAAFGTTSLAAAPIVIPGQYAAVLAVDYTQRHRFSGAEVETVEAIANATRLAVESEVRRQQLERAVVVDRALRANLATLAAARDVAAVRAAVRFTVGTLLPNATTSLELLDEDAAPAGSLHTSTDGGRRHVFKLTFATRHFGYLIVGGVRGSRDDLTVLEAVADQAALALDRVERERDLSHRVARADLMQQLSTVLSAQASPATLLARVNREIAQSAGLHCRDLAMRHRRHIDVFRCRALSVAEAGLLARSADDRHPVISAAGRRLFHVTVPVAGRAAGVLVVTASNDVLADIDLALLAAIALGIGQVAHASHLDRELTTSTRRLAFASVRQNLVEDLDQRLGVGLRALANGLGNELNAVDAGPARERWHRLHDIALRVVGDLQAVNGTLASIGVREEGLEATLRDVVRSFEHTTGIAVALRNDVDDGRVDPEVEEAIVAIVFDALSLVVRAGRSEFVAITITQGEGLLIEIRDDGAALEHRTTPEAPLGVHHAIASLRARVGHLGGRLVVQPSTPRGLALKASFALAANRGDDDGQRQHGVLLKLPASERPLS